MRENKIGMHGNNKATRKIIVITCINPCFGTAVIDLIRTVTAQPQRHKFFVLLGPTLLS